MYTRYQFTTRYECLLLKNYRNSNTVVKSMSLNKYNSYKLNLVCVLVCVYCTTSKVRFFSFSTYRTYACTVLAYHDTYYNMHKKVHMSMSETISYEDVEKDYKANYSKEGKDITVILYRYEGDVRLFGSTISRLPRLSSRH